MGWWNWFRVSSQSLNTAPLTHTHAHTPYTHNANQLCFCLTMFTQDLSTSFFFPSPGGSFWRIDGVNERVNKGGYVRISPWHQVPYCICINSAPFRVQTLSFSHTKHIRIAHQHGAPTWSIRIMKHVCERELRLFIFVSPILRT